MTFHKTGKQLLVLNLPISAILIGRLGNRLRLIIPVTGRGGWMEVYRASALLQLIVARVLTMISAKEREP